jgi:hypothetical protein
MGFTAALQPLNNILTGNPIPNFPNTLADLNNMQGLSHCSLQIQ